MRQLTVLDEVPRHNPLRRFCKTVACQVSTATFSSPDLRFSTLRVHSYYWGNNPDLIFIFMKRFLVFFFTPNKLFNNQSPKLETPSLPCYVTVIFPPRPPCYGPHALAADDLAPRSHLTIIKPPFRLDCAYRVTQIISRDIWETGRSASVGILCNL